jgi:hypothetical protein
VSQSLRSSAQTARASKHGRCSFVLCTLAPSSNMTASVGEGCFLYSLRSFSQQAKKVTSNQRAASLPSKRLGEAVREDKHVDSRATNGQRVTEPNYLVKRYASCEAARTHARKIRTK